MRQLGITYGKEKISCDIIDKRQLTRYEYVQTMNDKSLPRQAMKYKSQIKQSNSKRKLACGN